MILAAVAKAPSLPALSGPESATVTELVGLAIAREAVTAHGGHISVEPGQPGARFVVRLPASDDADPAG
jgi:signal transduction histidine kinase